MLFLFNSRICAGVTREQVLEHLKQPIRNEEWKRVKKGAIVDWYYKLDDQPGVIALVNCADMEEARSLASISPGVQAGLIEYEIDRLSHLPSFN